MYRLKHDYFLERSRRYRRDHPGYWKKAYFANHERSKETKRRDAWRRRIAVVNLLGGKCVNCGIADIRLLEINHINGLGDKKRRELWANQVKFFNSLLNGKTPKDGLEIRCANCNVLYEYDVGRRRLPNNLWPVEVPTPIVA